VLTVTKERDEAYPLDPGHFGEVVCALDLSEASEHTEESPPEEAAVADAGLDLSAYRAERSEEARQRLRARQAVIQLDVAVGSERGGRR
jgi:hypothetical protein